ncbi:MAG: hypothetical protein WD407_10175 [Rhodospirillales bacterium]
MPNHKRLGAFIILLSFFVLSPARAADQWVAPSFAPGWQNYDNGYRPVSALKSGTVVTLSGLARRAQGAKEWVPIATLPAGLRPARRMIFNVNTHDRTARVDVLPNGQILYVTGNTGYGWVSLDGISYSLTQGTALALASGWRNYSAQYAEARVVRAGDTVMVGGLVRPGSGALIARLPAHARPYKRHIFNLNVQDKTARVDVLADGRIMLVAGDTRHGYLSLNGITFERTPGKPLQLHGGWQNYGGEYAPATVTRSGNLVRVSGLIRGSQWGHVASLPAGLCPRNRLIFNLNNHDNTSRVDAIVDCRIYWVAGGRNHGWLSLDGFSFVLKPDRAPTASAPNATPAPSSLLTAARTLATQAKLNTEWQQWERAFKKDGDTLKADARLAGQPATVVIYVPRGQQQPNLAVLANNLRVGNVVKPAAGTPADDLAVVNVAYIFASHGNAERIDVNAMPGIVRHQVAKVRTGQVDIVEGHNLFATVDPRDAGTTAQLLKLIGADLNNLKVHLGYGKKKVQNKTVPYNSARLSLSEKWDRPFHLKDTSLTQGTTFELIKSGNVKTVRAWGMGTVKGKTYFLFLQKTGAKGPYPTAAVVDARSITLKDYKDIALVFGETVFGSIGAVQSVLAGIDKVPLDKIEVENPNYRPGGALDKDNNPVFADVLAMAAAPGETLPNANRTRGPVLIAHGIGKVFGHRAGAIDAWITNKGMDARTNVNLPKWGAMDLGTFGLSLYRSGGRYAMDLKGKAWVPGLVDENITIAADNGGFSYKLGASCPLRPVGISARFDGHTIGGGSGFKISQAGGNPLDCVAAIAETVKNAAGTVVKISAKAYSDSQKKVNKELKDIGKKAEKAAKWAANEIGKLFGKSKRKKPKRPSKEELRKLECAKNEGFYAKYVLWNDECRRNWVMKEKYSVSPTVRQSSTHPPGKLGNAPFPYDADKARNHLTRIPFVPDMALTKEQTNPWWEVEFPKIRAIREIVLFQPGMTPVPLKGLVVAISQTVSGDGLMTDTSGQVKRYKIDGDGAIAIVNTGKKHFLGTGTFHISEPLYARHMRIYRPGKGRVALGEVWALP